MNPEEFLKIRKENEVTILFNEQKIHENRLKEDTDASDKLYEYSKDAIKGFMGKGYQEVLVPCKGYINTNTLEIFKTQLGKDYEGFVFETTLIDRTESKWELLVKWIVEIKKSKSWFK